MLFKQFDKKKKQKSIMVKRNVPGYIQIHTEEIRNKRKRFIHVNESSTGLYVHGIAPTLTAERDISTPPPSISFNTNIYSI